MSLNPDNLKWRQPESLVQRALRVSTVRELARELHVAPGLRVERAVTDADGGYWVEARVWVSDTAVRDRLLRVDT